MKNCKKIISVFMFVLMLFGILYITPVAGAAEKYSLGDVDGNGNITAADARLALRASVQLENLSLGAMTAADVNGDDYVTASDARTILRVSVGLESFAVTPVVPAEMPETTAEICDFYKNGIDELKKGKAGYTKKEWQNVDPVNISYAFINEAVQGVIGNFMNTEADAPEKLSEKGTKDAMNRIAAWTLTDLSKVASAKCEKAGENYKITIIMKDETNPERGKSALEQVTNSFLYWEDIEKTLSEDHIIRSILMFYRDISITYRGFKIEAIMTSDGRFVSIEHTADVDINIGEMIILNFPVISKSAHMWNYCSYYNFRY